MVSGPYCARWLASLAELSATCAERLVTIGSIEVCHPGKPPGCAGNPCQHSSRRSSTSTCPPLKTGLVGLSSGLVCRSARALCGHDRTARGSRQGSTPSLCILTSVACSVMLSDFMAKNGHRSPNMTSELRVVYCSARDKRPGVDSN